MFSSLLVLPSEEYCIIEKYNILDYYDKKIEDQILYNCFSYIWSYLITYRNLFLFGLFWILIIHVSGLFFIYKKKINSISIRMSSITLSKILKVTRFKIRIPNTSIHINQKITYILILILMLKVFLNIWARNQISVFVLNIYALQSSTSLKNTFFRVDALPLFHTS